MKKLIAIVLTLLMVLSLPLAIAADEITTVADTTADSTLESVLDDGEATEPVEETEVAEPAAKTQFGFYPESMKETLPAMGMGMLGIFLVTSVIILSVLVLSKMGKSREE